MTGSGLPRLTPATYWITLAARTGWGSVGGVHVGVGERECQEPPPTRDLITWVVATLTGVVALVGAAIALFDPAKVDHQFV